MMIQLFNGVLSFFSSLRARRPAPQVEAAPRCVLHEDPFQKVLAVLEFETESRTAFLSDIQARAKAFGLPKPSAQDLRQRGMKSVLIDVALNGQPEGPVERVRMWTW